MVTVSGCSAREEMLVAPLDCFSRSDILLAGGKAANLGDLLRAGFDVPDGFVVTTQAYDRFVGRNGLAGLIDTLLEQDEPGQAIRSAFEASAIPEEIAAQIQAAYEKMGQKAVAVRSSATTEDLPEAAFAGQQDTYLNLIDAQSVLQAVRRCWASLWTDRAIAYRRRLGIDPGSVKLAAVVQCMVPAEVAGVMFTANPITGARDELAIDAAPGLGEAIVSGLVTPDHLVLDKRSGAVKEKRSGRWEVTIRPRVAGGTEHVAGEVVARTELLPARALSSLVRAGAAIEAHFGSPQDIEWAWHGGALSILQSRPMTALPEPLPKTGRLVSFYSAVFAEIFHVRPYPLDLSTWIPALSGGALAPMFHLVGVTIPSLSDLFVAEDGVAIRFSGRVDVRPTAKLFLAPFRMAGMALRYDPRRYAEDRALLAAQERARRLEGQDFRSLSWDELLQTVREALNLVYDLAGEPRRRYLPRTAFAAGILRVILTLLRRQGQFVDLLSGVESMTLEANRVLEELALVVRQDPVLAAAFQEHTTGELPAVLAALPQGRLFLDDLRQFLERFGHREVLLSTVLQPTWKDDPEIVLGLVKGLARSGETIREEKPAWLTAREALLAHPALRFPPLRRTVLRLLETARCLWLVRENTHFDAARVLPILRRTFLELGRRLSDLGVLDTPEEVFNLRFEELEKAGQTWPPPAVLRRELAEKAWRRKEHRARLADRPLVDPRLYRPRALEGDALLWGTPGSPGVATGPVRVIMEATEFEKLRSGEVLVAPYTNPAWTPLFQRAAAVIVDSGGAGSHAAIVAREYGIPAVMGTQSGTQALHDGDWVQVDGSRGAVTAAQPPK